MKPSPDVLRTARPPFWRLGGVALLALSGCAPIPVGPTVPVMPAPYKPMDVFAADDRLCREWARSAIGAAAAGDPSIHAYDVQDRYDIAYLQCMYSKGNLLPGVPPRTDAASVPPPPAGVQPLPP